MKLIIFIAIATLATISASAQPAKRRVQTTEQQAQQQAKQQQRVRQFPGAPSMSDDVSWRRDMYRTLDLQKDANAPLYYPVEPQGKQMNLFTYLFRLVLSGRVVAYNYSLDGNENFEASNKINVRDLMERYGIYYEENDGKISVAAQDIPSAEVTRYYIKESSYFDQRTSTYRQKVTALCPVLMRGADEFDTSATPYPLFWVKYADISTYLSRLQIMSSNLNNVTNMTADDFFTLNRYQGKIYKTNNMQGRVLANYCKDDSAMVREQNRIEKELKDFEAGIWTTQKADTTAKDSTELANATTKNKPKAQKTSESNATRRSQASAKVAKQRSSSSGTPRVSARRTRR